MGNCCSQSLKIEAKSCCATDPGVGIDPKKLGKEIFKIALGAVIAGQSMMFGLGINISPIEYGTDTYFFVHGALFLSALLVMALLGGPLFLSIINGIKKKQFTTEGLFFISMTGALIGSVIASLQGKDQIYYEVVAIVLVIYSIGRLVSSQSRSKALEECTRVQAEYDFAHIVDPNNPSQRLRVPITDLDCCSVVTVGVGETITVDGILLEGQADLLETAVNGELDPVNRTRGDTVYAGSHVMNGVVKIKPTGFKGDRKIDQLLDAVAQAQVSSSGMQDQASRIMQWFLPVILTACVGTFVYWFGKAPWVDALFNSMAVLLVACPCALGLATPVAVWTGLWNLSTLGIISRNGQFLDALARANHFIFDKTGTLSLGQLSVSSVIVHPCFNHSLVLSIIHAVESHVDHPIARSIAGYIQSEKLVELVDLEFFPGQGIGAQVKVEGQEYAVKLGDGSFIGDFSDPVFIGAEKGKRTIYCEINSKLCAKVTLEEEYRDSIDDLFLSIGSFGSKITILTGDNEVRRNFSSNISIYSGLDPVEKEAFVKECTGRGEVVLYVGDGMNDAAAMAASSGSLAMESGNSLAKSTSGGVLLGTRLDPLLAGVRLARKVRENVYASMKFAVCYNIVGIGLAAMGKLHPVVAALLMLVSSLWVSFRAVRLSRVQESFSAVEVKLA